MDWMVPVLTVEGLIAGQDTNLYLARATPGGTILWGYSLTGPGPTPTSSGDLMLSAPVHTLVNGTADEGGAAVVTQRFLTHFFAALGHVAPSLLHITTHSLLHWRIGVGRQTTEHDLCRRTW
ncbi:MAG: hypothetical protein O3A95_10315 [Planctomycetota bacterium]|nr:hypothetical protein [Planctomycetota bacterium]MDA1114677.1 hypothetical protein [Planctomycetota bacterium]